VPRRDAAHPEAVDIPTGKLTETTESSPYVSADRLPGRLPTSWHHGIGTHLRERGFADDFNNRRSAAPEYELPLMVEREK